MLTPSQKDKLIARGQPVSELQLLRPGGGSVAMTFELDNRAFCATAVADRGDAYFEHFTERLNELVADQEAGIGALYLLVDDNSSVLGRFNLDLSPDGTAELGYRVAQQACGQGVVTAAVRDLVELPQRIITEVGDHARESPRNCRRGRIIVRRLGVIHPELADTQ